MDSLVHSGTDIPLTLTSSAARRIAKVIAAEPEGTMLRLTVHGGGCSGFSYDFQLTRDGEPDDLVVERDGVELKVDSVALPYISGSEIDFVDNLMGQYFQVKNPNATATCGCGTSFSV